MFTGEDSQVEINEKEVDRVKELEEKSSSSHNTIDSFELTLKEKFKIDGSNLNEKSKVYRTFATQKSMKFKYVNFFFK